MSNSLTLISHYLCPYVQRAVIALEEKNAAFEKVYIDLAQKPDWFLEISPLGRVPVLKVGDTAIFESSVILEYIEDTQDNPMHPSDPLIRAQHRSWMEFGSTLLSDIGGFYSAKDSKTFADKTSAISNKLQLLENKLEEGPYFSGKEFSLTDAVYGPVFRYFDVFDKIQDFGVFQDKPKATGWRKALAERPSIQAAVTDDYEERLWNFLIARNSHLTSLMPNV
ncbi:MAG: glutathione S-transferase family protein [Methyloligellaceae bacterium]